jgi:hypothetical protein
MINTAPRLPDRFTQPVEDAAEVRGLARGESKALLFVIETRGVEISDDQRGQVEACTDLELLQSWLGRALTATTAEEVFGDA